MTEAELFDALIAYFEAIEAEATVFSPARVKTILVRAHQSAPRVEGPYASVMLLGVRDDGDADHACYSTATVSAAERIVEERVRAVSYLVRVDVYARDAQDRAAALFGALRSDRASVDLSPLAIGGLRQIARAPELIEQVWEGRASFQFEARALTRTKTLVDVIEHGTIEFEGDGGSLVTETTTY